VHLHTASDGSLSRWRGYVVTPKWSLEDNAAPVSRAGLCGVLGREWRYAVETIEHRSVSETQRHQDCASASALLSGWAQVVNESGSATACANLEASPRCTGGASALGRRSRNVLRSAPSSTATIRAIAVGTTASRACRPYGVQRHAVFHRSCAVVPPVVVYGSMSQRRFDLDEHAMDVDTAETLAGVVRLLRQAAGLAWAAADRTGDASPRQLFALGVDLAADQARHLVPNGTEIDGPVPVGDEPASLLRSAALLLRRLSPIVASPNLDDLVATVADLVWEANTVVDA
jgi:hypothetical protein